MGFWDKFFKKKTEDNGPLTQVEITLCELRVRYKKKPDGQIVATDCIDLSKKDLTVLPDLTDVIAWNGFNCSFNKLKSLKGAPKFVRGILLCCFNELETLEHAPETAVNGPAFFERNKLKNLEHAPKTFTVLHSDFGEFDSWQAVLNGPGATDAMRKAYLNTEGKKACVVPSAGKEQKQITTRRRQVKL